MAKAPKTEETTVEPATIPATTPAVVSTSDVKTDEAATGTTSPVTDAKTDDAPMGLALELEEEKHVRAEQVLTVSAPAGPRRRAGFAFGPEPIELTAADLGATKKDVEETLNALRADPRLKLDFTMREVPDDE